MTLFYSGDVIEHKVSNDLALRAMEVCFDAQAAGTTQLPPRIDTPTGRGFIRVMPAVLEDVMGLKVMTLVEGRGTRYLVMLYDVETGGLLAMFDADELTRLRTAAVTALAGNAMLALPPTELTLFGSGFEAIGHLRMMAHVWPLRRVRVYSPNEGRRKHFAAALARELNIEVIPAPTAREALAGAALVVLATKSKTPVLDGADLAAGSVVLSIGSTRLDFRELDNASLARASIVVADDPQMIQLESADIAETIAAEIFDPARIVALSAYRREKPALKPGGDVAVFKSVGTALQDLALARMLYRDESLRADATELPELTRLKPFAAKALAEVPA